MYNCNFEGINEGIKNRRKKKKKKTEMNMEYGPFV